MKQLGSHWTDFNDIWYVNTIRNSIEKFNFDENMANITSTLHEDLCTFMVVFS